MVNDEDRTVSVGFVAYTLHNSIIFIVEYSELVLLQMPPVENAIFRHGISLTTDWNAIII